MNGKAALCLLLLILPSLVLASPVLIDAQTGSVIDTAFVTLQANGTMHDYIVLPNQSLTLPPLPSDSLLLVRADSSVTYDHFARLAAGAMPERVPVIPAGLVIGEVQDARDNLIVHVPVTASCPTYASSVTTDATGQFRAVLPAGDCTLRVAAEGRVGNGSVRVVQGAIARTEVRVSADQRLAGRSLPAWPFILLVLVVLALAVLLRRKKQGAPKSSVFVAERAQGVLKEKERLIVDELLLRNGRMTVRELRFNTQLPRTSLMRVLAGLETRGILLKKEEHGRLTVELVRK